MIIESDMKKTRPVGKAITLLFGILTAISLFRVWFGDVVDGSNLSQLLMKSISGLSSGSEFDQVVSTLALPFAVALCFVISLLVVAAGMFVPAVYWIIYLVNSKKSKGIPVNEEERIKHGK